MKLTGQQPQGSFYESFSDLIFNTLVMFIIIVMALLLKLKDVKDKAEIEVQKQVQEQIEQRPDLSKDLEEAKKKAAEAERRAAAAEQKARMAEANAKVADDNAKAAKAKLNQLVSPNRYTGGSDQNYFYICAIPYNQGDGVVFLPSGIVARLDITKHPDTNDPVADLAQETLDGLVTILSDQQLADMGGDLPIHLNVHHPTMGAIIHLTRVAQTLDGTLQGPGAGVRLRDMLGGIDAYPASNFQISNQNLLQGLQEFVQFLYEGTDNIHHRYYGVIRPRYEQRTPIDVNNAPVLRFRTEPNRRSVFIGNTELTPVQFGGILRSIKPGRSFYIEHLTRGGEPTPAPDWLKREVLDAVGFNGRLVDEAALNE